MKFFIYLKTNGRNWHRSFFSAWMSHPKMRSQGIGWWRRNVEHENSMKVLSNQSRQTRLGAKLRHSYGELRIPPSRRSRAPWVYRLPVFSVANRNLSPQH